MKTRIGILLAALLILGLALPVYAAEPSGYGLAVVDWGDYPYGDGNTLEERDVLFGRADGTVDPEFSERFEALTPGTAIYLPVDLFAADRPLNGEDVQDTGSDPAAPDDALSYYEVSTQVDYGRLTLDRVELTRATDRSTGETGLYLAVRTKDNYSLYTQDVGLSITITARDGACLWTGETYQANGSTTLQLDFTTAYGVTYASEETTVEPDYPVVDFDEFDLEEIDLLFEGGVRFRVNAQDQSSLFLRYNTDPVSLAEDANPGKTLAFLTFEGTRKTFRNTGTLTLPVPESVGDSPRLYTVSRTGRLTEADASYNASSRTFTLATKSLDSYVFSSGALAADGH